jgi:Family of unknown function (DUF6448)
MRFRISGVTVAAICADTRVSSAERRKKMPPHCDSLDGPVVKAATQALEQRNVELVLPFVHEAGEQEVRDAFEQALRVEPLAPEAKRLADEWFFENVVRIHRAGEGAGYTGLKPAGLGHGPVVPVAEKAIANGRPDELVGLLTGMVEQEIRERFAQVMALKAHANGDLHANRAYVEAMLGLQVWSHSIYQALHASAHELHEHAH